MADAHYLLHLFLAFHTLMSFMFLVTSPSNILNGSVAGLSIAVMLTNLGSLLLFIRFYQQECLRFFGCLSTGATIR